MIEKDSNNKFTKEVSLSAVRTSQGMPSGEEIAISVEQYNPTLQLYLGEVDKNTKKLLQLFSNCRKSVKQKFNHDASRPELCNSFILDVIHKDLIQKTKQELDNGNMSKFRYLFDVSEGIAFVSIAITRGELELVDSDGSMRQQLVSVMGDEEQSDMSAQANLYLSIKKEDKKFLKLLIQDPSGFLLVDSRVEEVKKDALPSRASLGSPQRVCSSWSGICQGFI